MACSVDHESLKRDDSLWFSQPAARGGAEYHEPSLGVHLSTRNCAACGTTLSRPLPGHDDGGDWSDTTPVVDVSALACARGASEPVDQREGFVPAGVTA